MAMKVPMGPEYYDKLFTTGPGYRIHYKKSPYYVTWAQILLWLRHAQGPRILEIGCGTGMLAHYLYDEGFRDYHGFDFSPKAVEIARGVVPQSFSVGDALDKSSYEHDHNVAIATEILEHVADDRAIIRNLRRGTPFIFTLPTFDDVAHMRFFETGMKILERYRSLVDIEAIHPICRWYACMGRVR